MMVYYCCIVPDCKNTTVSNARKIFIKLPKEGKQRERWLLAIGRQPTDLSSKSSVCLCDDHFNLEEDMENYMKWKMTGCNKIMKKNIVPRIFSVQEYRKRCCPQPEQVTTTKKSKKSSCSSVIVIQDPGILCKPSISRTDLPMQPIKKCTLKENTVPSLNLAKFTKADTTQQKDLDEGMKMIELKNAHYTIYLHVVNIDGVIYGYQSKEKNLNKRIGFQTHDSLSSTSEGIGSIARDLTSVPGPSGIMQKRIPVASKKSSSLTKTYSEAVLNAEHYSSVLDNAGSKKKKKNFVADLTISDFSTPEKRKINFKTFKSTIIQNRKQMQTLQMQVKRLENQIRSLTTRLEEQTNLQ